MSKYVAKPQLRFMEAVKLACGRLCDFSGRSRRSEFWWFALAFVVVNWVLELIFSFALPLLWAEICSEVVSLLMLAVMVRRLQDTGRSKWWAISAWVLSVAGGIYTATRPAMEDLQSVNQDPDAVMAMFQDPVMIILLGLSAVVGIVVFVFTLLDGKPETNQYGESPKYVAVDE